MLRNEDSGWVENSLEVAKKKKKEVKKPPTLEPSDIRVLGDRQPL